MKPLVSVITPTWHRPAGLARAIGSVKKQTIRHLTEHIVISDGPDEVFRHEQERFSGPDGPYEGVRFAELETHDPAARWGHRCRMLGITMARGDFIAWLDDDNAYRPEHLELTVGRLTETGAGFAYSISMFRRPGNDYPVGSEPPAYTQIDTSVIVHRREILELATWRDEGQETIEWDLVERWIQAGVGWAFVPAITVDNYQDRA